MKYVTSVVLSVLFPGFSQLYSRNYFRAVAYLVLLVLFVTIAKFTVLSAFVGFAFLIGLELVFRVYVLIEGVLLVRRNVNLNRWYQLLPIFAGAIAMCLVSSPDSIGSFGYYRSFSASSKNMSQTLEVGDHIVVSYKPEDVSGVQYGDIIVYEDLGHPRISRVVAVAGDTIEMAKGILLVNGTQAMQTFAYFDDPMGADIREAEKNDPNDFTVARFQTIERQTVGNNSVYVLGDNRFNSFDSRFFGDLSREKIVAKVLYLSYSEDFSRFGITFAAAK